MIISALSSYLEDSTRKITDVVKYYPIIQYTDPGSGTQKEDIMNKYFLMLDGTNNKRSTEETT